jgi:Family of unknown function (DUF6502)
MIFSARPPPSPTAPSPTAPSPTAPLPNASLLKAARRLLRPLIRLMMQNGLTFPVLADTLRGLFVEVAINDILTDPKARTDSRISLLTGVHRKEIKRLREMPPELCDTPDVVTLASQIVGRWVGTAPFINRDGHPRPLPRAAPGTEASFDNLIEQITTDIRPRAILDSLLSHGVVLLDAQDRVQLKAEAFIPRPGGEEQLFYFARNLHDHVAAAVANVATAQAPPFLDRSVHYDGLTPAQARALHVYARAAAMQVLLDVNRQALALAEAEPGAGPGCTWRVNFGVYVFDEAESPPGDSTA